MDDTKNEEIEENEEIEFDFISDDEDEEINLVTEEKEKNKTKRKFRVKSFTKVIAVVLIFALVFGFSIGLGVGFINNKYFANNENPTTIMWPSNDKFVYMEISNNVWGADFVLAYLEKHPSTLNEEIVEVVEGPELLNFEINYEINHFVFDAFYIYQNFYIDEEIVSVEQEYLGGAAHTQYFIPCVEGEVLKATSFNSISNQLTTTSFDISDYSCQEILEVIEGPEILNFKVEDNKFIFDAFYIYQHLYLDGEEVFPEKSYLGGAVHTLYEMPCIENQEILEAESVNHNSNALTATSFDIPDYSCEEIVDESSLENYPSIFIESDGAFNGLFVYGAAAPTRDVINMNRIIGSVQAACLKQTWHSNDNESGYWETEVIPIPSSATVLDIDIINPRSENIIAVGSPCDNNVVAELLDIDEADCNEMEDGVGFIFLLDENEGMANGRHAVISTGKDQENDLSAMVLANYNDYDLDGKDICITGDSIESMQVNNC